MYIPRTIEATIRQASDKFYVLIVTGPRQIGKTTVLRKCSEQNRQYISLDNLKNRALAKNNPELFIKINPPPILIDEIQYVPELLSCIINICERECKPGLFWLCGTNKLNLMTQVPNSFIDNIAALDLLGLSQAEIHNHAYENRPVLPTSEWLCNAKKNANDKSSVLDVFKRIWVGSFPEISLHPGTDRGLFYTSYIKTHIQQNMQEIYKDSNWTVFYRFLRAVANNTAQLLNHAILARNAGINCTQAKYWLRILESFGIIYLLHSYDSHQDRDVIKFSKIYFSDTGLCAYLTGWKSAEILASSTMAGHILETYAFIEILKSYINNGKKVNLNYYRNVNEKEIDLIINQNNTLYPIEMKKTDNPTISSAVNFNYLLGLKKNIGRGMVICLATKDIPLSSNIDAIPVGYI